MNDWISDHYKWVFVAPALIFMVLMIVVPIVMTLAFSLTDWNLLTGRAPSFNGLANYIEILKSPDFWHSFGITFYYTFLAIAMELVAGVLLAVLINKDFRGKGVVKTIILLPYMMAPVAVGMMWMLFYEPTSGFMNWLFTTIGLPRSGFTSARGSVIPSLAFVEFWQMTPMVVIVCMAGVAALPEDCMEAAVVDGATPIQTFFRVKLPMLLPTIFSIGLLRFVDVFKSFDLIYAMTKGGPANASRTLNIYAYEEAFSYYKFGLSSSILTVVFIIVLAISFATMKLKNKVVEV